MIITWISNSKSVVNTKNPTEKIEIKNNELDQKINDTKRLLEEKLKIVDKISVEDKNKLESIKKNLEDAILSKDEKKVKQLQEELQTIKIVESIQQENKEDTTITSNKPESNSTEENVTEEAKQITETKAEEKKETKKEKTCRIVTIPAVTKTVHHPEKFRMEPIMEQRYAKCAFMSDGSEVDITGWSIEKKLLLWINTE